MSQEPCKNETATQKINRYLEKSLIWIVGILISFSVAMWNKQESRIDSLEDKVVTLFQEKVSRQELKEEMSLMRLQIDKMYTDISRGQDQMKTDILSRLELILKFSGSRNLE